VNPAFSPHLLPSWRMRWRRETPETQSDVRYAAMNGPTADAL